ncbi:hypothetical protein V6N13_076551 [Hibiscus sabdariffa]|uniref:Uncharacterized protein n=1 Tax=Hibiscus sabdariffa TaxID=183260 RepID=A0ABR2B4U4_9ROSI
MLPYKHRPYAQYDVAWRMLFRPRRMCLKLESWPRITDRSGASKRTLFSLELGWFEPGEVEVGSKTEASVQNTIAE